VSVCVYINVLACLGVFVSVCLCVLNKYMSVHASLCVLVHFFGLCVRVCVCV